MISLLAITLLSAYPNWSDVENILISNADIVFVGVYQGIGESRDVPILDEAGRETGEMIQLDRHDYRPILVLRGEVRAALVSLLYVNAGRMKGQPVPVGTTQIQYGYAPRGNLFRTNGLVDYFRQTGPNQFYNNWLYYQSQANVPNKTYIIEGDTPVERYISVLVQAYQSEPENVALLERAKSVMPQVQIRDGRPVIENGRLVIVAGQDNPDIYDFVAEKLTPRLLSVRPNDPVYRLRGLYYAYALGDRRWLEEHQQLLQRIDREHQDREEPFIEGVLGEDEFKIRMLSSRLAATRRAAIKSLKFVPGYRSPIISALLNDESQMVKAEAARWLNNLISADVNLHGSQSQYLDAPRANIGPGFRISNYDEVAEFWRNRG